MQDLRLAGNCVVSSKAATHGREAEVPTPLATLENLHTLPPLAAFSAPWCSVIDERAALRERVREANDIVDVVGERIALRPAGPIHKGLCPFHADKHPSLTVDSRRQRYKCWSCGEGGDVFQFVQKFEKITFPEALEVLARRAGISLEKIQKSPQGPSRAGMLDVMR